MCLCHCNNLDKEKKVSKKKHDLTIGKLLEVNEYFFPVYNDVDNKFESNGCTCFFNLEHRHCCDVHDWTYYIGGCKKARWEADKLLFQCVKDNYPAYVGIPLACIMFAGVRVFGSPYFRFNKRRWGYCYNWDKGIRYTEPKE